MATSADDSNTGSTSYSMPSGGGNIFIKNMDRAIDNKSLFDTFSLFGSILSCKVAVDEEGRSKGYGFVHFETEEAARDAVEKADGMTLAGREIFVGKFQPRSQRLREMGVNVFVKNFDEHIDDDKLRKMFEKFGEIVSCIVMRDSQKKSRGFGFVSFKNAEDADNAIKETHATNFAGSWRKLYVCRAMKKNEREAELKKSHEEQKEENGQNSEEVNLYVKNIDETLDDEALKNVFDPFGKITSVKVMTDENSRSKGFGFVCFENADDARKAIKGLNCRMVCSKPLYVAFAQRKSDRRAQLASQFMERHAKTRLRDNGASGGAVPTPGQGAYFAANTTQDQHGVAPESGIGASGVSLGQNGGWQMQEHQYGQQAMVYGGAPMYQQAGAYPSGSPPNTATPHYSAPGAGLNISGPPRSVQPGVYAGQPHAGYYQIPAAYGTPAMYQQYYLTQQAQAAQRSTAGAQDTLTLHMLAQATPEEQKQVLGERIYAMIQRMYPGLKEAGRITGMMLEMDNAELVMLLQDVNLFHGKLKEAASVLQQSAKKPLPSLMHPIRT